VSQSWKLELEQTWRELELPQFLTELGVDFDATFLKPMREYPGSENPYQGFYWTFFRLDRLPPGVFHAAPKKQVVQGVPATWEEWFIEGSELHHHTMRNHATAPANLPSGSELIQWRSPENDIEHPTEVLDINWHYFNDSDLTPYLFRSE